MKPLIILFSTALLAACDLPNTYDGTITENKGFRGSVTTFSTKEGLECVFARRGGAGGLSCDWNNQ